MDFAHMIEIALLYENLMRLISIFLIDWSINNIMAE
jgi:hypothetical protein